MEETKEQTVEAEQGQPQVETEENQPQKETAVKQADERRANKYELTLAIGNLVCQATVLLCMIFGAATLFSSTVNPVSAVINIIALFSIKKGRIYETLAGVAGSVVYIVFMAFIIKSTVFAVKLFIRIVKKGKGYAKSGDLYYGYVETRKVTFKAVLFMALCYILSGSALTAGSYITITVFLLNYVLASTLFFVLRNKANLRTKEGIAELVFYVLREGLLIACLCLAAQYLIMPSGPDISFGLYSLFGSVKWSAKILLTMYELVVKHIIDIVIALFFLFMLDELFDDAGYSESTGVYFNKSLRNYTKRIMIVAAVAAAIACIVFGVGCFNVKIDALLFESLFYMLKVQYLPAIILSGALFALSYLVFDSKKDPPVLHRAAA